MRLSLEEQIIRNGMQRHCALGPHYSQSPAGLIEAVAKTIKKHYTVDERICLADVPWLILVTLRCAEAAIIFQSVTQRGKVLTQDRS
jgi:hypothetical protein